jgi:hypothetical protein
LIIVMAGLVPDIRAFSVANQTDVDGRHDAGHDEATSAFA